MQCQNRGCDLEGQNREYNSSLEDVHLKGI